MFELILGILGVLISPVLGIYNYILWKKRNAGFRESKKENPDSDDYSSSFYIQRVFLSGFIFMVGLYLVIEYFENLNQ